MENKKKVSQDHANKEQDNKKSKKILPRQDADTSSPTPGSMSEGNLSNNEFGRVRRRTPHAKTFITGSDDDGQTV